MRNSKKIHIHTERIMNHFLYVPASGAVVESSYHKSILKKKKKNADLKF